MADLVRVWTADPGIALTNRSVPAGSAFEVVLNVEAESGEFALGAQYSAGAVAINRTTGAVSGPLAAVAGSPAYGAVANMGPATLWDPELDEFRYTVPDTFGDANDLIEAIAFITVGAGVSKESHFSSSHVIRV